MCVIAVQKTSQPTLTYDEVKAMATKNPHGFGIMWTDGIKTYYKKGFFYVDSFYQEYLRIKNSPTVTDLALHFRIATGSNVDEQNCHPFPITSNKQRMKSTNGTADVCVMMNGIIGNSTKEFSDTALYVMSNLKEYYDWDRRFWLHFEKRDLAMFENEIHGTRWVFLSKEGSKLFGSGWTDYENKCKVSNRYWIPITENNFYYGNPNRFFKTENKTYKSYIDYLTEGVV